jgi:hypothetical protein
MSVMAVSSGPGFSVASLFDDREKTRRREAEDEARLKQKNDEELAAFRKRLDEFTLTEANVQAVMDRVRRAFNRNETELLLTRFPSAFCTDSGRIIGNLSLPRPAERFSDKPDQADVDSEPDWLATLPKGARQIYDYWRVHLKPGGFGFIARIIDYPGGMPGDVGLFFTWPKSATGS